MHMVIWQESGSVPQFVDEFHKLEDASRELAELQANSEGRGWVVENCSILDNDSQDIIEGLENE
jgi:hypothetical protein